MTAAVTAAVTAATGTAAAPAPLVPTGVQAVDALASATSMGAELCGLADRKGRLRAGFDADLLVVEGDALADITALRRVQAVFVRGQRV